MMSDIVYRIPAFGFETKNLRAAQTEDDLEVNYIYSNIEKMVGYIPIIGTGMGIIRLYVSKDLDPILYSKTNLIIRAIIETASLGIIILPFDLGVTAGRKFKQIFPYDLGEVAKRKFKQIQADLKKPKN